MANMFFLLNVLTPLVFMALYSCNIFPEAEKVTDMYIHNIAADTNPD